MSAPRLVHGLRLVARKMATSGTMLGWFAQAILGLTALGLTAVCAMADSAHAAPALRQPLHLTFQLQVDRDAPASGQLWLLPTGSSCIHTASPVLQRLWLSSEGLALYYPNSGELLRHLAVKDALPSFVDAIVVSLRHPADALPRGAKQIRSTSGGGKIVSAWQVSDQSGSLVQVIETHETAGGVQQMTVNDSKQKRLRVYHFGKRRRFGGLSVPATIEATYYGRDGKSRTERWSLSAPTAAVTAPRQESSCLVLGKVSKETRF